MIIIINENIFYNNNYCYIVFSLLVLLHVHYCLKVDFHILKSLMLTKTAFI